MSADRSRDDPTGPRPADELSDWTQDAAGESVPPLAPDTSAAPDSSAAPPSPWTTDPPAARRPSRSRLADWISGPETAPVSTLDDWVQGPIETRSELDAEDAWSTADAVSGTAPREERAGEDADGPAPARRSRPAFRAELHGLRAVALGLVAVYHIWLGRVSGGVDVFLFLSAFFLTGTFVRRLEAGRPLGVPRYWLHTFKRLLPPAAVTILLTLAATAVLLPPSAWPAIMQQAVASALYLENALLVLLQVDYQARDAGAASPLQHFWSLSVQGQAFVVWPLLFALMVGRARRGKPVRRPLLVIMLLIAAASLAWSVHSTQTQQPIAYFDTAARLWEFAAGSMLALALPALDRLTGGHRPEDPLRPRGRAPRALLGWAGIAVLLGCGVVLDVSAQFPGWIAAVPLAGAAAVVVAGHSGTRWGVDRLLSTRPAAFVGDISYALYLVHWPILVMWLHHSDQQRAGLLDGLAVLAGSVLLAWTITRLVDSPVRRSRWLEARPWRAVAAVAASVALVAGTAGGWWVLLQRGAEAGPSEVATPALPTDEVATAAPATILPYGWQLGDQWPDLPEACGGPWAPDTTFPHVRCDQLLPADADPSGVVVVVGSSHARQYIPAILPWAEENDLQVVNLAMDGCEFLPDTEESSYCDGYAEYVLRYLDEQQPDAVLTTVTHTSEDPDQEETTPEGMRNAAEEITSRGIDLIGVRDTPRWAEDQYACAEDVIRSGGTPVDADEACGADASAVYAPTSPAADLADLATDEAQVELLDLTSSICPDGRCAPILGDTYVYLDEDHLTRLFVERTLAPAASRELADLDPAAGGS